MPLSISVGAWAQRVARLAGLPVAALATVRSCRVASCRWSRVSVRALAFTLPSPIRSGRPCLLWRMRMCVCQCPCVAWVCVYVPVFTFTHSLSLTVFGPRAQTIWGAVAYQTGVGGDGACSWRCLRMGERSRAALWVTLWTAAPRPPPSHGWPLSTAWSVPKYAPPWAPSTCVASFTLSLSLSVCVCTLHFVAGAGGGRWL
jgi:hypothetical protein